MNKEDPKSSIESMRERLYRRKFTQDKKNVRGEFYSRRPEVSTGWENKEEGITEDLMETSKMTFFQKLFIGSLIFFVAAVGIAAFLFFGGSNIVSSENVDIDVLGPVSVDGGEELSLQIVVKNNNSTALEYTDLLIEYPIGANDPDDISKELSRYRKSLGVIKSGETVNEIIRSVLFGEENEEKDIVVKLEYRVSGSNAVFVKEILYTINISSSPVSVSMDLLKEVNANQDMEIKINVASNSEETIKNVLLRLEYPFGFEPTSATPETTYSNNIWELGDIPAGEKISIRIIGTMKAQDNEVKIFGALLGRQDDNKERDIATVYSSSFEEVNVKKPFIGVVLALDGVSSDEYVVDSTEIVRGSLSWTNNLSTQITDAVIEARIEGDVLNKFSVDVDRGVYNSSNNTIVWNKNTLPELASIEPGKTGRMTFTFSAKSLIGSETSHLREPEINISISARGKRASESGAQEEINEFISQRVLVNTKLSLNSRAVYYSGPFGNSGPIPPKAENQTTYTVIWSVSNSSNSLSDVEVSGVLPPSVSWLSTVAPSSESITFNGGTGEVVWRIGDVDAGIGTVSGVRQVAFQIGLVPSVSHIGKIPELVTNIVIRGDDDFTGEGVSESKNPLTTNLTTDSVFNPENAQVVQ